MGTLAQYLPPDFLASAAFILILVMVFGGALIAVLPKNLVQNVTGLAVSLIGVAGLFIYLGSEFVALMQILIYVGAICIAIIFAIMLSEPEHLSIPPRIRPKVYLALIASGGILVIFGLMAGRTLWPLGTTRGADWSLKRLGDLLLTNYELMFELISLILLVAIIGSVITAASVGLIGRTKSGQTGGRS
ncbi:MAG: NADH-quinone oxidoreductase subunit J [Thermodesulfobacteriota bacterium]